MQNQETGASRGLTVHLEIAEPVVAGLTVLAHLYVTNKSKEPVTVSSRLNLMEGDVQILLTGPDGRQQKVAGAGGQADTFPREATLLPDQQIAAAFNLLYTDIGETFGTPGPYTLQAVYFPSSDMPPVHSDPVTVVVRAPQTEVEQQVASILRDDDVKRAIVIPEKDHLPGGLRELADGFENTQDGELASLILGGAAGEGAGADSADSPFSTADPVKTAMQITALSTPFSDIGSEISESFATVLDKQSSESAEKEEADTGQAEKALSILKSTPFE